MPSADKRKIVAAIQITLDGFTQGPSGETEWVESWAEAMNLIDNVDAFIVGGRMYPAYGLHWQGIHEDPTAPAPFLERLPTKREIDYAKKAYSSTHYIISRTLEGVEWPPTAVVTGIDQLREFKSKEGGNIYVAGGATLIAALLDAGLVDELRLIVHPIAIGQGAGLFAEITTELRLDLIDASPDDHGRVVLAYRVKPGSHEMQV